jgi:DNA repair exonuclease SbcCD ATPase subunit
MNSRSNRNLSNIRERISYEYRDYEEQAAAYRELKKQLDDLKQQRDKLEEKRASCDEFSDEYDQIVKELQILNETIREQEEALNDQRQRTKKAKEALDDSPEQQAYQQAQHEYEAFEETHQAIINEDRQALSDEEELTLKIAYRRAARLCHPDLVSDELKDQAHRIMQALNLAKDKGDLAAVEQILYKLQNGLGFEVASNTITDKNVLRAKIAELRQRIDDLHAEMAEMQQSTAVQVASVPADWDEYLNEKEAQLQSEYRRLFQKLAEANPDAVNERVEVTRSTSPDDGDDFWRRTF